MKFAQMSRRLMQKRFLDKLWVDDLFDLSASLAYYTALAFAPLLILLLTFLSMFGTQFKLDLLEEIQGVLGSQASETIKNIALNADQRSQIRDWAGFLGLLTLLFSAGAIFGQLRMSLNKIFEVTPDEAESQNESFFHTSWGFLKEKIFNMGMVLAFVFISIVSLVVSSVLTLVLRGFAAFLGQSLNLIISLLIFGFLFSSIYYFLPAKRIRPKVAIYSGFITSVLFALGKSLIAVYIGTSAVASLYGAAGSLIVLLMWVYYSSLIIFLSAEIAHQMNKEEEKEEHKDDKIPSTLKSV